MQASILSIGSELLRGDIVDTNAAFLGRELSQLGFQVRHVQAIGDLLPELTEAIRADLRETEVTICTGGLGPTQDDLTRQAIAAAVGEEMYVDPELLAQLEARFSAMRRSMPASNQQQATLIPCAQALPNPHGTAPGWFVTHEGRRIAAMPGPPREMEPMWRDQVRPRLERLLPGCRAMRALMTFGLGESAVEERIREVIDRRPDVIVATYAKTNGVQVHVTATAGSQDDAERLVRETVQDLRALLGRAVFGEGDVTLSQVVGGMLTQRGSTLAALESCTGGELASLITNTDGSSGYFLGGVVAYTRNAKVRHGVADALLNRFGLISAETAEAMASAAREEFEADFGVGTTGVAGREAVEGKPTGTVFLAVDGPGGSTVREIHRPGDRETIKQFAAQSALDLLRRFLMDEKAES